MAVDAAAVRSLGRMPLVIQNGADMNAGRRMVDEIRQQLSLFTVSVEGSTLNDLIRGASSDQEALQALWALVKNQKFVARPFECVRDEMDGWRSKEERLLKKFESDRKTCEVLVRDLR